jgi:hypothetical protein
LADALEPDPSAVASDADAFAPFANAQLSDAALLFRPTATAACADAVEPTPIAIAPKVPLEVELLPIAMPSVFDATWVAADLLLCMQIAPVPSAVVLGASPT